MRYLKKIFFISVLVMTSLAVLPAEDRWSLGVETGLVTVGRNTVQVPNPGGTRFSLSNDFELNKKVYSRIRLSYLLARRHQLSLLVAPLTITGDGIPDQDVRFENSTFSPGEKIAAVYRFNSYRLTYRYLLLERKKIRLWLGFTAKIRDAKIRLASASLEDQTTNVGFVPLLNLYMDWNFSKKAGLLVEVDALAAPGGQGRAEDVALSLYTRLGNKNRISIGYRFIEGGADVEQVYNFAFINYFFTAIQFRF